MIRAGLSAVRLAGVRSAGLAITLAIRGANRMGILHWPFVSHMISGLPFAFGLQLRQEVYRRAGGGCGGGTMLLPGLFVEDRRTRFGGEVWVSANVHVDYALIDNYVMIGPHAVLLSGRRTHHAERIDIPIKMQGNPPKEPIRIGEGAWIGANATVMADVGRHAIVGAGAVVVDPVPDYAVAVGNPARVIRDRQQLELSSKSRQKSS